MKNDLSKIRDCIIQRKLSFSPNQPKQAQEVIFSRKRQNSNHDSTYFNRNLVQEALSQKRLGMHLDTKLNFQAHFDTIMSRVDKTFG